MNTTITNNDVRLLLSLVGHDLRGPLNVMSLASEVLENSNQPASPSLIARVRRSTARLDRLIAEVTEFVHARFAGGLSISPAPVTARELIEAAKGRLHRYWPDSPVAVEVEPGEIELDGARAEQAIVWLLSSRLEAGAAPRLHCLVVDGALEVEVADRGPGVAPEKLEAPSRDALGLFLASEVARAHGGEASCRVDGSETRICLRFPGVSTGHSGAD